MEEIKKASIKEVVFLVNNSRTAAYIEIKTNHRYVLRKKYFKHYNNLAVGACFTKSFTRGGDYQQRCETVSSVAFSFRLVCFYVHSTNPFKLK